jgi:hypothetical protein
MLQVIERKGISMGDDGFHNDGWFPHDGEGKIDSCPGPGCDCDEKNYGYVSHNCRKKSSGSGIWIAMIVALIIGYGFNELIGIIIVIGVIFYSVLCM